MNCSIKHVLLHVWIWIKALLAWLVYEVKKPVESTSTEATQQQSGRAQDEQVKSTTVKHRRSLPPVCRTVAMARPKNPRRSMSMSEEDDCLFELQKQHSSKAYEYVAKALQIDEASRGQ
jgi:organic radical activating enzyme